MFTVKIQDAAKAAGLSPVFVKSLEHTLEHARQGAALVILDLNNAATDTLDIISQLKTDPQTSTISTLGYVSHVQTDVRQAALDRGCDVVMPRSAFSTNLAATLRRYAPAVIPSS